MSVRRLTLVLAVLLLAVMAPSSASAWTGHCLPGNTGPMCHFWLAHVTSVSDGDTIDVDIAGDHTHRTFPVRWVGIQAMELHVYSFKHPERRRGECNGIPADNRLTQLIRQSHMQVRLAAQHTWAHAGHRLDRSVAVKIGGHWRDTGDILLKEGHVLWMSSAVEWAWNARYNVDEHIGMQTGKYMWNPVMCGYGPQQEVPIRTWVSSDPLGADTEHINGEYFKVQNLSPTEPLDLSNWWLRDSMLRRFTFPAGTVLQPGETATLHAGHGTRSGNEFYWGLDQPPFQNPGTYKHLGDGGFLFDPQGDLRASMEYPCVVSCSDPNMGAIQVTAHPNTPEYVALKNVSDHSVDLYGYNLWTNGSTYDFAPDSVVGPGQTMLVFTGSPSWRDAVATRGLGLGLARYWGLPSYELPDGGGSVRLQTFSDITLSCSAWGRGSC